MDWKSVKIPSGSKLFKVHNFNFLYQGNNYLIEVDEYSDGSYTGHAEHATDKNYVMESVGAKKLEACISGVVAKIVEREK